MKETATIHTNVFTTFDRRVPAKIAEASYKDNTPILRGSSKPLDYILESGIKYIRSYVKRCALLELHWVLASQEGTNENGWSEWKTASW